MVAFMNKEDLNSSKKTQDPKFLKKIQQTKGNFQESLRAIHKESDADTRIS